MGCIWYSANFIVFVIVYLGPLFFLIAENHGKKRNLKFVTEFYGINQFVACIFSVNKN